MLRCDCRRVEAASTSTVAGMAGEHTVSSTVEEQESTVKPSDKFLNDSDLFLTGQNSKFDMETRNLAKIKGLEEGKIYNFRFGRKLIWSSDRGQK